MQEAQRHSMKNDTLMLGVVQAPPGAPFSHEVWTHPCSPDLPICLNVLEHLQNVQLSEKWENKSLVSTAHWTDPWQFENSLRPLLFADFDKFLLHQAAPIQTDVLLIYGVTLSFFLRMMYLPDADVSARCPCVGVPSGMTPTRRSCQHQNAVNTACRKWGDCICRHPANRHTAGETGHVTHRVAWWGRPVGAWRHVPKREHGVRQ